MIAGLTESRHVEAEKKWEILRCEEHKPRHVMAGLTNVKELGKSCELNKLRILSKNDEKNNWLYGYLDYLRKLAAGR